MIWWNCDDDDDDDDDNGDEDEDDGDGDDNDNDDDDDDDDDDYDDEFLYLFSIFKVFFPKIGKMGELTSGSGWELLNLNTSTILSMPYDDIEMQTGLEHGAFMDVMSDYLYESIGAPEFARRRPLIEKICVVVPSIAHISFTKAVTVLWLGKNNLVKVAVDDESKMSSGGKSKGRLDV